MKEKICKEIAQFVARYQENNHIKTHWREPLVGFASADDPLFDELKKVVSPTHALPKDLLASARTVIAFFIPFEKDVGHSNMDGRMASQEWVYAYIEANTLIEKLSLHIKVYLEDLGFAVCITPPTHHFDPIKLVSDWSHRHVAFITGLGRFGLNNMLITKSGCCGRVGSLITSMEIEADIRPETEVCLYHYDASCLRCVERCVNEALFPDAFDRKKCYSMCLENEAFYQETGKADVCGKCVVGLPCSWKDPVKSKLEGKKENYLQE
jgi:epoxyqueuosine reductase QueG